MSVTDPKEETRPGVEGAILPQAGESLRKEAEKIIFDRFGPWATIFASAVVLCGMEWWRYAFHIPTTLQGAIGVSVFCAVIAVISLYRLLKYRGVYENLHKGIRGEQHIGRYLDDVCRGMGYRVLHDVCENDFNVDHVLIGPGGVFAIETKNWTKPSKKIGARIVVDGMRLNKSDGTFDVKAIQETKANADFIRDILAKRTNRNPRMIPVFPVLLVPGWYVEDRTPKPKSIWVLADNVLHTFLEKEPVFVSEADSALMYESLAEYSRNKAN